MTGNFHKAIISLWAKKSNNKGLLKWLPLIVHLNDTMNVAGWLWNHWLSKGQQEYIIRQMDEPNEIVAERTVRFLGAVHDIGKATAAFQTQQGFTSPELQQTLLEQLERAGYTGISELKLTSPRNTPHALAGEFILKQYGIRDDLASIIGAHHGRPVDDISICEEQEYYHANYCQSEDLTASVASLWKDSQSYILFWALEQNGIDSVDRLPSFSKTAQFLLSGLLIMADWIASNESYFPLLPLDGFAEIDNEQRFKLGMQQWFKNRPLEFEAPDSEHDLYVKRFGFSPRDLQETIFATIQAVEHPGIVIIEAPTGCGKTEAALVTAEQLAAKTCRAGLFFGLPTQATSNGIFPRIRDWLSSVSDEYGAASLRLVHGKAALNPIMQQLSMSSHVADDQGADETILVNEWFSGRKKSSLDDIVVGTVDNFLMASLKQKHLALRHLGFDKKVVIIDEVHEKLFWDQSNWQALCKPCHDHKTMTGDRFVEYKYKKKNPTHQVPFRA